MSRKNNASSRGADALVQSKPQHLPSNKKGESKKRGASPPPAPAFAGPQPSKRLKSSSAAATQPAESKEKEDFIAAMTTKKGKSAPGPSWADLPPTEAEAVPRTGVEEEEMGEAEDDASAEEGESHAAPAEDAMDDEAWMKTMMTGTLQEDPAEEAPQSAPVAVQVIDAAATVQSAEVSVRLYWMFKHPV